MPKRSSVVTACAAAGVVLFSQQAFVPAPQVNRRAQISAVAGSAAALGATATPMWWTTLETGDSIKLEHVATGFWLGLIIATSWSGKQGKGDGLLLARPTQPYHRLLVTRSAKSPLRWKVTLGGADALWLFEPADGAGQRGETAAAETFVVRARSTKAMHLMMDAQGQLTAGDSGAGAEWRRVLPSASPQPAAVVATLAEGGPSAAAVRDIGGCYHQFCEQGFTIVPQLVGQEACDRALRLVNHHLGQAGSRQAAPGAHGLGAEFLPIAGVAEADASSDGGGDAAGVVKLGSLALHQVLNKGLVGAPELETIAQALQLPEASVKEPVGAQLALRFPLPPLPAQLQGQQEADVDTLQGLLGRLTWHTDTDKYNDRKTFDFVLGVFLSPVRAATDGGLWVLPASHQRMGQRTLPLSCEEGEVPTPILTASAGDAVIFHRRLVHAGGPCLAPSIRYATYYRMHVEGGHVRFGQLV